MQDTWEEKQTTLWQTNTDIHTHKHMYTHMHKDMHEHIIGYCKCEVCWLKLNSHLLVKYLFPSPTFSLKG